MKYHLAIDIGASSGRHIIGYVENGEIPACEMERLCQMVEDICYNNAKNYFNF